MTAKYSLVDSMIRANGAVIDQDDKKLFQYIFEVKDVMKDTDFQQFLNSMREFVAISGNDMFIYNFMLKFKEIPFTVRDVLNAYKCGEKQFIVLCNCIKKMDEKHFFKNVFHFVCLHVRVHFTKEEQETFYNISNINQIPKSIHC